MLRHVLIFSLLFFVSVAHAEVQRVREIRYLMGTRAEITVFSSEPEKAKLAIREALAEAERLDSLLSIYKTDSELSRFNSSSQPVEVSSTFMDFLKVAEKAFKDTQGVFDISIYPLRKLWSDHLKKGKLPSQSIIAKVRGHTGFERIELQGSFIVTRPEGFQIDSGGLGKGYAVDRMVRILRKAGITSALVNLGESSIRAIGTPPDAAAWSVLFIYPDGSPLGIVSLNDRALSASYSHSQSISLHGANYGSLIDPTSGWPVTRRVRTAVVASHATTAEIHSTALAVKHGREKIAVQPYPYPVYVQTQESELVGVAFPLERKEQGGK